MPKPPSCLTGVHFVAGRLLELGAFVRGLGEDEACDPGQLS